MAKTTAKAKANTKTTTKKQTTKIPKLAAQEGIILGPIEQLLADKESKKFKEDQDKFRDYPIQFVADDNHLREGFLQDAIEREIATGIKGKKSQYKLALIILSIEEDKIYTVTKTCIAPVDCNIQWSTVQCRTNIT